MKKYTPRFDQLSIGAEVEAEITLWNGEKRTQHGYIIHLWPETQDVSVMMAAPTVYWTVNINQLWIVKPE